MKRLVLILIFAINGCSVIDSKDPLLGVKWEQNAGNRFGSSYEFSSEGTVHYAMYSDVFPFANSHDGTYQQIGNQITIKFAEQEVTHDNLAFDEVNGLYLDGTQKTYIFKAYQVELYLQKIDGSFCLSKKISGNCYYQIVK